MKWLILVLVFLGCSGGGGGSNNDREDPTIEDAAFFKDGVESVSFKIGDAVNFAIIAVDGDKDMEDLNVEQYLYPDLQTPLYNGSLILPDQTDKRMEYFTLSSFLIDGPAGEWRTCFYIVDSEGGESRDFCINTVTRN